MAGIGYISGLGGGNNTLSVPSSDVFYYRDINVTGEIAGTTTQNAYTSGFTLCMDVCVQNNGATSDYQALLHRASAARAEIGVGFGNTNELLVYTGSESLASMSAYNSGVFFEIGKRIHFAIVGEENGSPIKIYKDGVFVDYLRNAGTPIGVNSVTVGNIVYTYSLIGVSIFKVAAFANLLYAKKPIWRTAFTPPDKIKVV